MFICRYLRYIAQSWYVQANQKRKTNRRYNSKHRLETDQKHDGQPTSSGGHVSGRPDIRLQTTPMYVLRGQGHQTTRTRLTRSRRRCVAWLVHRARPLKPYKTMLTSIPHIPRTPLYRIIILFPLPIWGTGGRYVGMPCGRARCRHQSILGCLPTEHEPLEALSER